jgi:hypothetical protein
MARAFTCFVAFCLALAYEGNALGDCPERLQRDPAFTAFAVDDNAPQPKSTDDFKFIGDTTTLDELQAKVGPPSGAKGARTFLYCLADGTVIEVQSRTGSDIRSVRVNGKAFYKRK